MRDIDELRREIDETDDVLMRMFCRRMDIAREIGAYKRRNSLPISDPVREREAFKRRNKAMHKTPYGYYAKAFLLPLVKIAKEVQRFDQNVYLTGLTDEAARTAALAVQGHIKRDIIFIGAEAESMGCAKETLTSVNVEGCRKTGREALLDAAQKGCSLVVVNGGLIEHGNNVKLLRMSGRLVFIDTPDTPDAQTALREKYKALADMTLAADDPELKAILCAYCME